MKVLDLFSCIGGHALGLHAAGGFETVQFVECDDYRRRVLAHHFPGVPIDDDVTTFQARPGSADVIVGGPPCQKTSNAAAIHGKRTGGSLWCEMRRIIADVGSADWIVVEQPTASEAWQAQVERDLASLGYRTTRIVLAASDFGAPHIRRRVFTLAHPSLPRLQIAREAGPRTIESLSRRAFAGNPWREGPPRSLPVDAGLSRGLARRRRIEAIGDSNPPIMMTAIGMMIQRAECA